MRRLRPSLTGTIIITLVSTVGISVSAQVEEPAERILFVGNSFTFNAGGVDNLFEGLVASEDDPPLIEVDDRTRGGATLTTHLSGAPLKIEDGGYSVVVLQGDIPENSTHTVDPFFDAARTLDAAVQDSGGRTVFYMAWPYARLGWIGLDAIAAAHQQIAEELGADVAPVGLAMANALTERPELAMLDGDLEHQTVHAAYLAAAVIYATVFDRSPEGLPYSFPSVSDEEASFLQRVAWETVQEWQAGTPVPAPTAAAWVTGTESCTFDSNASAAASATFDGGIWGITDLPLSCRHTADDPRVTGTATVVWNCDCQLGVGSPVSGSWNLAGPDGSWAGRYEGIRSAEGDQRMLLVADGTDAYEGLTYLAALTADGPVTSFEGVISEAHTALQAEPVPAE